MPYNQSSGIHTLRTLVERDVALTQVDRELLQRCLSGSPDGWRDFVNRFLGLFIHIVNHCAQSRSVTLGKEDVEDLCSDVLLALLDRDFAILRQFREQSSLATYLCVVGRRIIVRQLQQKRLAEAFGHVSVPESVVQSLGAAPSEQQRIDDREQIDLMLAGLAEPEASIIRQYHLEGRTYREISNDLGIPENSIGPTLTRARARLRTKQLQQ